MRVGVIGLGLIGATVSQRLLAAGHTVALYNRTPEKADALVESGATLYPTPAALAAESEIVLSCLLDGNALRAVCEGENGVLATLPPNAIFADMSTIAPAEAECMAQQFRTAKRRYIQAPILGSIRQIESGTLLIFAGGKEAEIVQCETVWQAFASRVWHFKTPREAATTKLACNLFIAHTIVGLGQSLLLAKKGGVRPELLLSIFQNSALNSPMVASKGKTLLERNFKANFVVKNMLKDLNLISEAGMETKTPLPLHALTRELFLAAVQAGFQDEDYSAVIKVLEQMSGTVLKL
jgi:3-hydroxyisobutyrate dehydrogenase-like beta-hydroxyacid dehydrogenase